MKKKAKEIISTVLFFNVGAILILHFIYVGLIKYGIRTDRYYLDNSFYIEGEIIDSYSDISYKNNRIIHINLDTIVLFKHNIENKKELNIFYENIMFSGLYDEVNNEAYMIINVPYPDYDSLTGSKVLIDTSDMSHLILTRKGYTETFGIHIRGNKISSKMTKLQKHNLDWIAF